MTPVEMVTAVYAAASTTSGEAARSGRMMAMIDDDNNRGHCRAALRHVAKTADSLSRTDHPIEGLLGLFAWMSDFSGIILSNLGEDWLESWLEGWSDAGR